MKRGGAVRHQEKNVTVRGLTPTEPQYVSDDLEPVLEPDFELSTEEKVANLISLGFEEGEIEMLLDEFDYEDIIETYGNASAFEGYDLDNIQNEDKRILAELTMEYLYHPENNLENGPENVSEEIWEEIDGGKRRGTKRRGTKRRGTKRRGTKRRGTKRRGTKRRGTKRRGTKRR